MNKTRKKQLLGNLRTPLPKKTERIHKDKRKYNRKKQAKQLITHSHNGSHIPFAAYRVCEKCGEVFEETK
jgi:hypothetical protein